MTNREKLTRELAGKEYYDDPTVYEDYLTENDLDPDDEYDKGTMEKKLFKTVFSVLDALSRDIDLYRRIETEFSTTGEAYRALEKQLERLQWRINTMPDNAGEKRNSAVCMLWHD